MSLISRRRFLSISVFLVVPMLGAGLAAAQTAKPPAGRRIALSGYDPVAYFVDGRPEKGSSAHWYAFDDAIYYFRSARHREMFTADPERYAPQYAGFCAAGLSKGHKVEPDPEAWAIANGKLFVFRLKERVADFKKNPQAFIDKANANWPGLRGAPARAR